MEITLFNNLFSILSYKQFWENISNFLRPIKIVIEHDSLKAYNDIEKAKDILVFHAAFYPKYIGDRNPHQHSIEYALQNQKTLNVHIIVTDYSAIWMDEFTKVLRNEYPKDSLINHIKDNIESINILKNKYPSRVYLHQAKALPFMPIIIADNIIFVGHYAHSQYPAPDGFWIKIKYKKICNFFNILYNIEDLPDNLSPKEKAIIRYIEDCLYTIQEKQ